MLLSDFTPDIVIEHKDEHNHFILNGRIHEGIMNVSFDNQPKQVTKGLARNAKKFFSNNLIKLAAGVWAVSAIKNYHKNNKRNIKFVASSNSKEEKDFYDQVVRDLMSTGHYVKVNTPSIGGYSSWELKKI